MLLKTDRDNDTMIVFVIDSSNDDLLYHNDKSRAEKHTSSTKILSISNSHVPGSCLQ